MWKTWLLLAEVTGKYLSRRWMAFYVRKLLVAMCTSLSLGEIFSTGGSDQILSFWWDVVHCSSGWLLNYFVCYTLCVSIGLLDRFQRQTAKNKSEFPFFFFPLVRFPFKERRWLCENTSGLKWLSDICVNTISLYWMFVFSE